MLWEKKTRFMPVSRSLLVQRSTLTGECQQTAFFVVRFLDIFFFDAFIAFAFILRRPLI
jgi:hypothetical protein